MRNFLKVAGIGVFVLGGLVACDKEPGTEPGDAAMPTERGDAGAGADGAGPLAFQGCPESIPPFELGMQAAGEKKIFKVAVLEAMPSEPERYINDWSVEVRTMDGEPAPDAEITQARTFMPVHGHDGNVEPEMMSGSEPGHVDVNRLNFTMRGPWEVQLWLHSESLGNDFVVFDVCVAK